MNRPALIYAYGNHHRRELRLVRDIRSFHVCKVGGGTKNTNLEVSFGY